jgi:hypothetical protein
MRKGILLALVFFMAGTASAHQPKLTFDRASSPGAPFVVTKPEISQAFYGRLKGASDYYLIESSVPFHLYLNILSPAIEGARQDYSVELNGQRVIDAAGGWQKYYEPFAGDTYWKGPEYEKDAGPGRYAVTVSNPGDTGKYVLAVGQAESFTPAESWETLLQLPKLKTGYFQKPFLAVFEGIIGKFLLAVMLIFSGIIVFALRRIKR